VQQQDGRRAAAGMDARAGPRAWHVPGTGEHAGSELFADHAQGARHADLILVRRGTGDTPAHQKIVRIDRQAHQHDARQADGRSLPRLGAGPGGGRANGAGNQRLYEQDEAQQQARTHAGNLSERSSRYGAVSMRSVSMRRI
jgi:hypothetical protein